MFSRYTIDVTAERLVEMEQTIVAQRRELVRASDSAARASAARTLATLEDILLLMQRTRRLPS